jgi:hypothetical protein
MCSSDRKGNTHRAVPRFLTNLPAPGEVDYKISSPDGAGGRPADTYSEILAAGPHFP